MRTALLVPLAAVTLAGCSGATPTSNGTATATTTATTTTTNTTPTANIVATTATTETTKTTVSGGVPTAASLGIRPGKWENKVEILDMEMPNAPPQQQAAIRKGIASRPPQVVISCLSPEDAAKGPASTMIDKAHCSFTRADTSGGHISTATTCNMPNGTLTSTGEGSYSPTSYSVDGHGSMTGRVSMSMHMRSSGKWLGECDGTEINAKGRK